MESFWWGLMALTTVGNGEKSPSTLAGKVGLIFLTFHMLEFDIAMELSLCRCC